MPSLPAGRLAAAIVCLAGCEVGVELPAGAQISCASTADCPSAMICHNGLCAAADALDIKPPDLVGPPSVTPAVGTAGTTFSIEFETTAPLLEPARITLGLVPP